MTELRPGVWRLVASSGFDRVTGRRRQIARVVHGTKSEASRELAKLLVEAGNRAAITDATVAHMLERYMARATLARTTRVDFARVIDGILLPRLGTLPLAAITTALLSDEWDRAERDGLSRHRLRRAHVVLSNAWREAIRWGWVPPGPSPMSGAPPRPADRQRRREVPTQDVMRALLQLVEQDPEMSAWLWLAMSTGARRGEVLGLQWRHVDWAGRRVKIEGSVQYAPDGLGVALGPTKTHAERWVPLIDDAVTALQRLRDDRAAQLARLGRPLPDDAWVLCNPDGWPWHPSTVSRRFRHLRARVPGAEAVRLHDLRHAAATYMLGAGHDVRTVADVLGHADPSVTLAVYAASTRQTERDAVDALGAMLRPQGSTREG